MIEKKEVLSFNYYTYGQAFTGSDAGKRYRIIKEDREEGSVFLVSVWKEPFSYENTPGEEILEKEFDFNPEGLDLAIQFINQTSVM